LSHVTILSSWSSSLWFAKLYLLIGIIKGISFYIYILSEISFFPPVTQNLNDYYNFHQLLTNAPCQQPPDCLKCVTSQT